MRFYNILPLCVVILSAVVCSFLITKESLTCKNINPNEHMSGHSPLKLTPKPVEQLTLGPYIENIFIEMWIKDEDFGQTVKLEIQEAHTKKELIPIIIKKKRNRRNKHSGQMKQNEPNMIVKCPHNNITAWKLECQIRAKTSDSVTVSFRNYSASHTVPAPVPAFHLSVDRSARSFNVTVNTGDRVHTRLCYQKDRNVCEGHSNRTTIDPSSSRSAIFNFPYLLPCLCVEAYYTYEDAHRYQKCPFKHEPLAMMDVWRSSNITLSTQIDNLSIITWESNCSKRYLNPSASLCWKQQANLCTPLLNSTLDQIAHRQYLAYNISALDKHPRMCVQFSLNGSHSFHCPFRSDTSTWEADIEPDRQTVFVYVTSSITATYCAQLCFLNKTECSPTGPVTAVKMEGKTSAGMQVYVPLHLITDNTCVQVWQSDPAQRGRRILCLDNTHRRFGIYAVAVLVFVVIVALLGVIIHQVAKMGAAGWLSIQKPVLLVCSSESSAHVSAVYALASILQRELCTTVRLAQWSQVSEMDAGTRAGPGLADMGPLPWLYGQWDAIQKAEGKVLIIWSPNAKVSYEKWREERVESDKKKKKGEDYKEIVWLREDLEDWKVKGRRQEKGKKVKHAGKQDYGKLHHNENSAPADFSSITEPVFLAALACIQGVLQERGKDSGVVLAYFQGLGHRKDIPKDLRVFPRYCLPQDFRGLIQELGGTISGTKSDTFGCDCWPRLLSKTLSLWLARRLAYRLRTLLPESEQKVQACKRRSLKSSLDVMSDGTQGKLNLPLLPDMATVGTVQKQDAPPMWPRRGDTLGSKVSLI